MVIDYFCFFLEDDDLQCQDIKAIVLKAFMGLRLLARYQNPNSQGKTQTLKPGEKGLGDPKSADLYGYKLSSCELSIMMVSMHHRFSYI